jgi:hypothetical protein
VHVRGPALNNARLHTLPGTPPDILVSGFGPKSTQLAARIGDGYMPVSPDADMVAQQVVHGPDPQPYVDAIRGYADAGFDELYIGQMGPDQEGLIRFLRDRVLPQVGWAPRTTGRLRDHEVSCSAAAIRNTKTYETRRKEPDSKS